jgi:hypothetical protein
MGPFCEVKKESVEFYHLLLWAGELFGLIPVPVLGYTAA